MDNGLLVKLNWHDQQLNHSILNLNCGLKTDPYLCTMFYVYCNIILILLVYC